ncbi:aminopeptidase [Paenibacillus sp. YN15]|nr:aminopeptidase [Paenibacillus sp. YN15]
MKPSFEICLERYAELVIKIGAALRKGHSLWINSNLDSAPFARLLASKAYEAGAAHVQMDWVDEASTRIRYEQAPEETLRTPPEWRTKAMEAHMEAGGSFLQIYAPNPSLLKGLPPERIAIGNKAQAEAMQGFRRYVNQNLNAWSMASVPTPAWAAAVFPQLSLAEAQDALWDRIFQVNRVYEPDPLAAWEAHLKALNRRKDYMNAKRYRRLHYKAPGTDLVIGLPEGHIWKAATSETPDGIVFLPNMPTEEIFTMPHKDEVNGTVASTLPLPYSGSVIEGFSLTFKDGAVTDFSAAEGYEPLKSLIEMDEGSRRLGEVALVPHHSPISDLGITFYNTMFDENAACHLALGNAYSFTLENGTAMSREELSSRGANASLAHVDFMMGSGELDIDGETADGTLEPIFRKGNWAFS